MSDNLRVVTLTLTQNCNLKCSYCYEHHKSKATMSFETAKKIIDEELNRAKDDEEIEFDLFGGEPFLEFPLIKQITEYLCHRKKKAKCQLFASTNGTLVHGEVKEWLQQHRGCFVCGLSLDGTREMHNINRSNSYDDIDIDFFRNTYPEQDVKMTISKETLPNLAEGVIELHEKGFKISCNLAYQIDWSDEANAKILECELNKLIEYYLEHPEIEPCSMLEMSISNVAVCKDDALRFCGAGLSMRSYNVDGEFYPCQFFMPLSLGEEKAKRSKEIVFPKDILPKEKLDRKCVSCVVRSVCPNCLGSNYASTGDIYKRDDNMCLLTKIILKARAYFKALQWEKGQLKGTEEEINATLRSIVKIQEELVI